MKTQGILGKRRTSLPSAASFGLAQLRQVGVFGLLKAGGLVVLSSCATAGPLVTAHISQKDSREISVIVRTVTREPIISIDPVYERQRRPGSIPHERVEVRLATGGQTETKPVVVYERIDRVAVRTGSEGNRKGGSYELQRVGHTWTIVFRSFWIH